MLEERVSNQLIGVRSSVTMGALRSIRVFVLGGVITTRAQHGQRAFHDHQCTVRQWGHEDASHHCARSSSSARACTSFSTCTTCRWTGIPARTSAWQPGDVIFIPSIGLTVKVAGEVNLTGDLTAASRGPTTAGNVIAIARGLTSQADPRLTTVERVGANHVRSVISLDLGQAGTAAQIVGGVTWSGYRSIPTNVHRFSVDSWLMPTGPDPCSSAAVCA